jgi:hypothetical protein
MNLTSQRAIIWVLIITGPLLVVAFWPLAGLIPLPSPAASAEEVAAMYAGRSNGIAWAMMMWVCLWTVWMAFSGVVAAQLSRREQGFPLWSLIQFGGGALLSMIVILTSLFWSVASYRPERDPQVIQALHDMGWFLFVMPAGPLGVQILGIGLVALSDKAPSPPLPRWFGYLSLWVFTLTLPGFAIIHFHRGLLAWNGVLALWIPAMAFGVWICCLVPLLLKAIREQQATPDPAAAKASPPQIDRTQLPEIAGTEHKPLPNPNAGHHPHREVL